VLVTAALTEANSVRGIARLAEVDKGTVMAVGLQVGDGCALLHDRLVRGLRSLVIQGDETWSFICKKESRVDPMKDPPEYGDAYTFIGLDAISKLVISYYVGKRDGASADVFAADMRARLTMVPHLSTDGFPAYPEVIAKHFAGAIDYGTAVKHYTHGAQRGPDHRYEPPRDPFVTKHAILGAPTMALIGTPHVERYNLTQRHIVGRTRRLCLAFSKTLRGHQAAISLGVFAYNFVREHSALGPHVTPAMAAGLTDHPWTIAEMVDAALAALAEEPGEKPQPVPLKMPAARAGQPVGASRALPNGRGFVRAVNAAAPAAKSPAAPPPAPPPAPTPPPALVAIPSGSATPGQLDLLAWRPPPPAPQAPASPPAQPSQRLPPGQLDLFGLDLEPEPKQ
jgi:IS1 family transposase